MDQPTKFYELTRMLIELQVAQHHNAAHEDGRGVGLVLARNVRRRAVDRLHQRQAVRACNVMIMQGSAHAGISRTELSDSNAID